MKTNSSDLVALNGEIASILLPAIILISVFILLGVIGNPLVVFYYGWHKKPLPSYNFIVAMAIFDFIICCFSMPMEIVDMVYLYDFPDEIACKIFRFINYFASLSSALTLIAIAVDRYKKVCQPFKIQTTGKLSKIIITITIVISLFVASPIFVFYDITTVNTTEPEIVGYDCTTIRNDDLKLYITIFNGFCFLLFVVAIHTLIVIYILIGRKLSKLKRFRFSMRMSTNVSRLVNTPPTSSSQIDAHNIRNDMKSSECKEATAPQDNEAKLNVNTLNESIKVSKDGKSTNYTRNIQNNAVSDSDSGDFKSKISLKAKDSFKRTYSLRRETKLNDKYIHLRKYTILMFSITAAFIVSFVPHLVIATWRTLVQEHEGTLFSNNEFVVYNIFIRSWLLSSVSNPIIYGLFNPDFRLYVLSTFKRVFCCCHKNSALNPETHFSK